MQHQLFQRRFGHRAVEVMWKRFFRDVIETTSPPPELGREEKRRYYVAYGIWFLLMVSGLAIGLVAAFVVAFIVINGADAFWSGGMEAVWRASSDTAYSRQNSYIGLPLMLALGLLGFFAANAFWYFLFIKSGYLSEAAVRRLSSNRAPTEQGERIRVGIGYVTYLLIFFGLGIPMLIFGDRTPLQIFAAVGLNGLGIYTAIHAFLRYRKKN
jgi:hypothetical protein